jgi:predicted short-subunit dehydrogenase-like oxidoreductase (DUF2520 family)
MRIVIIGAGNVATVLGRAIKNAGHDIIQVISRKQETAQLLANELGCEAATGFAEIDKTAHLFLIAMADVALGELKEKFNVGDKLVVHTAGSVSMEVLKDITTNYGVLYPLQSLRKEKIDQSVNIPLLIEGNNDHALAGIEGFAKSISDLVSVANEEQRLKLHIAAVVTSNFSNHLFCLAAEYCQSENLDFKMLQPLIEETALRLREHHPCNVQTGPAARKDIVTLDKHLRILNAYPKLRTVYLRMTDSIMNP